jgi:hypothetical protein
VIADLEEEEGDDDDDDDRGEVDELCREDVGVSVGKYDKVVALDIDKGKDDDYVRSVRVEGLDQH